MPPDAAWEGSIGSLVHATGNNHITMGCDSQFRLGGGSDKPPTSEVGFDCDAESVQQTTNSGMAIGLLSVGKQDESQFTVGFRQRLGISHLLSLLAQLKHKNPKVGTEFCESSSGGVRAQISSVPTSCRGLP